MPQLRVNSIGHLGRLLRSPWLAVGVIVLAVAAAYSNSLSGPFFFDDVPTVVRNPTIRSLWPITKVLNPPGDGMPVQGRPIVNLSLALNYALGKEAVSGYHLVNLTIHVLAALVLFGIVRRTLLLPDQPEHLAGRSTGMALAIALLWGVHPLCTAAVTYVSQRTELLVAIFYLLALYCVIRSASADRRGLCLWQTAAVLACLLGMGCKEVMVSAPLVVLLYDRVFLSRSLRECFRHRGLLYAGLAATWVFLAWLVIRAGTRGGTAGFGGEVAWWKYGLTQFQAVVIYLKLCFWPHPLVFDYGTDVITDPLKVWPQALLLAVLLGGVLAAFRRQPWLGFLGASFIAVLAPSSSMVPVMTQTVAEHRMYLPLAIVVALSVLLVRQGWGQIWAIRKQGGRHWRQAPALALAATTILLGGLTFHRNADYHSELAIWSDTISKRPENARAYGNRGNAYRQVGQFQQAIQDYTRVIALTPSDAGAYSNRGTVYQSLGQYQEALADYARAIALKPDYVLAFNNRAKTYQRMGQFRPALEDFGRAITLKPGEALTYYNRAETYQSLGRFQDALDDYTQAIALKPDYADAYCNRGALYKSLGQFQQALDDYNQALLLNPDYVEAYSNRGALYQSLGQFQQALADLTRAVALKPDFAAAYVNRGTTYRSLGQFEQALEDFSRAIALQSDYAEPYYDRGILYQHLGQFREALEDLSQAIVLKPDDFEAYNNRAIVCQHLGQSDRALQDLTQAVALKPDFALAFYNRAKALYSLKQYDRAWADVNRAKQLGHVPQSEFIRALSEASARSGNENPHGTGRPEGERGSKSSPPPAPQ